MSVYNQKKTSGKQVPQTKKSDKAIENIVNISLTDILLKEEVDELLKNNQFSFGADKNYTYGKVELILNIISLAISKFQTYNEIPLSKCLTWVKKEIQLNLEFNPDMNTFKKFEKMKETKPSLKMKIGWLEQYSALNKQEDIYKMASKNSAKERGTYCMSTQQSHIYANHRNSTSEDLNRTFKYEFSKVNESLLNFESPEFNIFKLEKKIGQENILPIVGTYVFSSLNLFNIIDYKKFEGFIYQVAKGYHRKNPYHTDLHAADMMQTLLAYFLHGNLRNTLMLQDLDIISLFVAASIHDIGHPGLTNNFLINERNKVAITYNDQSVLENFHASGGFNIILNIPGCNIFEDLANDSFKVIRKQIILNVLATDMTLHSKQFQFLKIRSQTFNISNGNNVDKIFENLDPVTLFNIKQDFLNVLIHGADVSNPTKPLEIYKIWAKKVIDEFFLQGDREKIMGIPVSFNCDRETVSLAKSQLGFIEGIVLPFFSVLTEFFPGIHFTVDNLNINKEYFKDAKEKEEKEKENKAADEEEKKNSIPNSNANPSANLKINSSFNNNNSNSPIKNKQINKKENNGNFNSPVYEIQEDKSKNLNNLTQNKETLKIKVTKNNNHGKK